jgi:GntR family transcriptional regulator, rspAB operon transcriptional repressor
MLTIYNIPFERIPLMTGRRVTPVRSLREQIAAHLRADILSGAIARGEPMREVPLAERFGVSRGPIRDVLAQLTQEGMLTAERNCGVRVSEAPDEWMQPVIIGLRRMIETASMEHLIKQRVAVDLRSLDAIVDRLHEACENHEMAVITELDLEFHQTLLELAGDGDVVAIWRPIVTRMIMHYSRHKNMDQSYREHVAILEAVRERDLKKAVQALEDNIQ